MKKIDEGLLLAAPAAAGIRLHETLPAAGTLPRPSDERADGRWRSDPPTGRKDERLPLERLAEEELLGLVYKLFVHPHTGTRRTVLFAGVERDNRCAEICLRAAKTLAELRPGGVCLIDANPRSTHGDEHAESAFARPPYAHDANSLLVLPADSIELDAALMTPARAQSRLRELGARFEHILICALPADEHAVSLGLGSVVDGVVLVVSANATRRDAVARVKSRLDALHVPVLGVVLSDRTYPIPQSLYRLV
jgi:hypothetical protein